MSSIPIIVIGAGGHAVVVADALLSVGATVLGFTDTRAELAGSQICGLPVLGNDEVLATRTSQNVNLANGLGGTGKNAPRRAVQQRLESEGWHFIGVQHPSAIVSPFATIGDAVQLLVGCVVQARARLGDGCIVNSAAIVEHDVELGEFAHVAPGAIVCGAARVGKESHVGAGAVLLQGVSVGSLTLIGAGAVVVKNFKGNGLLVGVPTKSVGLVK